MDAGDEAALSLDRLGVEVSLNQRFEEALEGHFPLQKGVKVNGRVFGQESLLLALVAGVVGAPEDGDGAGRQRLDAFGEMVGELLVPKEIGETGDVRHGFREPLV